MSHVLQHLLLVFCWLITVGISDARANEYYASTQRITAREGLPETTLFSIAKDKKGFLWFGTPTSLIRYDGYEFREYSDRQVADRTLAVSGAGNIFIDSKQRLWIGTWGEGLVVYDKHMQLLHHFTYTPNTPGSLGGNKIQVVFEDSRGDIWIGTNGGGLSLYHPQDNSFVNFTHDPLKAFSISHDRVWSIAESSPGVLWIATSNGLNRLNTNVNNRAQAQFIHYYGEPNKKDTLNHSMVRSLFVDSNSRLWVGSQIDFGLFDTELGLFHKIELVGSDGVNIVTRIREDLRGNILVATLQGLYQYNPTTRQLSPWAENSRFQLFPENDIRDILVDDNGLLWVSTRYAGLIKIDLNPSSFQPQQYYLEQDELLPMSKVYGMMVDHNQTLWLGTFNGLLYRPDKEKFFRRYPLSEQLKGQSIAAITAGAEETIWLGTRSHLFMLDLATGTLHNKDELMTSVPTNNIRSLLYDSQGGLWIGTAHDGLVYVQSPAQIIHFTADSSQANSLSGNSVQTLFEDSNQQIWIGTTSAGLSRYDLRNLKFTQFQHQAQNENSIADNTINAIYQTNEGTMWIATPKTLEKFSSNKFTHYYVADGLANSNIKALIQDGEGQLWLSSIQGVSQLLRSDNIFHNFNAPEEVAKINFLPGVATKNSRGHLFFGGVGGITEINPRTLKTGGKAPNTEITNVWADNQRLTASEFSVAPILQLPPKSKGIQLEFAALDFHRPFENKYLYQLEGIDQHWQGPKTSRIASYSGLAPGQYIFKVKAANSKNIWSEKVTTLTIDVPMPWYDLWWLRILILIVILSLLYFLGVFRTSHIARKKASLELEVAARTQELDEKNEQLATIIASLNSSQKKLVEKEKMASLGQMVAGIAHEVNTPIGLGITASTLLRQRIEEIRALFDEKKLNATQFDKFLQESLQNADLIYRNLERAASLINGFKQVAVDQSSEKARYFNLSNILDDIVLSISPQLRHVKHKLIVNCSKNVEVYSKPGAFSQVVINLVLNSINHAFAQTDKGVMTIDVTVQDKVCKLIYQDNGCGVPAQLKKNIFDPFVTTKRGKGLTGLGLHLVYNMVTQAMGGSIKFDSEIDQGIEVTVTFPVDVRDTRTKDMGYV